MVHFCAASLGIRFDLPIMIANIIGFCAALIVSLVGHHKVSFPGRTSFWRGARRFLPAAVTAFVVNNLALLGLIAITGTSYGWLKVAVAILVVPPATFGYAYFFAYRD